MNDEEFKDFKNYIKNYRNFTNDLVNKCITPYMLEQFRGYNDRFDYEPDLYAKYDVLGSIDNLQQKNQQLIDKINKAIEICKHHLKYSTNDGFMESVVEEILVQLAFDEKKADELIEKCDEILGDSDE